MGTHRDAYERVDSYHTCLRGVTSLIVDTVCSRNGQLAVIGILHSRLTPCPHAQYSASMDPLSNHGTGDRAGTTTQQNDLTPANREPPHGGRSVSI